MLALGGEFLVRGASTLASKLGVSTFFVGLIVVGFGTSSPELATAIVASLKGQGDIVVGNVVGSNLMNICVILGLTAMICPIPINVRVVRDEVIMVICVSFLAFACMVLQADVTAWEGAVLLTGLACYIARSIRIAKRKPRKNDVILEQEFEHESELVRPTWHSGYTGMISLLVVGVVVLAFGSELLVRSAGNIARTMGISELVIGLTVVAFGTSAPELVTSLVAAYRKQSELSVGNILGSNIFNLLGILSVGAMINPISIKPQVLWLDGPLMILVAIALLPIMMSGARISRKEGIGLLGVYGVYLALLYAAAPHWFPATT